MQTQLNTLRGDLDLLKGVKDYAKEREKEIAALESDKKLILAGQRYSSTIR